jgi:hypothetical protein
MDSASIKAAIIEFHEEYWNKGNMDVVAKFLSPKYVGTDLATGKTEGYAEINQRPTATNLHIDLYDITVEGDRAAFRWAASGNEPGGTHFHVVGINLYTFENGKVVTNSFLSAAFKPE